MARLTSQSVESYLGEAERVEHRLVSHDGPVTCENQGSKTTLSPAGDCGSVTVVTDGRVLFVVGNGERQGEDAVVSVPYPEIESVEAADGLMRTRFSIETVDEERFAIAPDDGDFEAAAEYVRGVVYDWQRASDLLDKATYLARQAGDESKRDRSAILGQRTENALKRASQALGKVQDRPIDEVDELLAHLEDVWLNSYVTHGEECWQRASEAREAGEIDEAIAELEAALSAFDRAETIASDHGFDRIDPIHERIHEIEHGLETVRIQPLSTGKAAIERAHDATELTAEIEAWIEAHEAFCRIQASEWATLDGAIQDEAGTVQLQLAWIAGNLVDRLDRRASELAAEATERQEAGETDAAREQFERARELLERVASLAETYDLAVESPDAKIAALDEEIEMTKWEWGGD